MTQTLASSWWTLAWRRAGMRLRSTWRPHALFLHAPQTRTADVDAAIAAFGRWCAAHEGAACELGLSSRWLLSSVADPTLDADAARLQAMQQWTHYLDLDEAVLASDWVLRQVVQGDVSVVCAAPRVLIDGLRGQAALHAVSLNGVGPWWARAVQGWLASRQPGPGDRTEHALHLVEPGLVTCALASQGTTGSAVLQRIWVEQGVSASAMTLTLPSPPCATGERADERAQAKPDGIWDHAAMASLLMGHDEALQVLA